MSRISQIAVIAWQGSSFALRHAFAIAFLTITACALWTLCYVALLLWAIISDEGLGGPLAYPAGLLAVFLTSLGMSLFVYFPATAIAAGFAKKYQLSFLRQIGICIVISALLHLIAALVIGEDPSQTPGERWGLYGALFCLNLIPLGLYWWCAQGWLVCLHVARRLLHRLRGTPTTGDSRSPKPLP